MRGLGCRPDTMNESLILGQSCLILGRPDHDHHSYLPDPDVAYSAASISRLSIFN